MIRTAHAAQRLIETGPQNKLNPCAQSVVAILLVVLVVGIQAIDRLDNYNRRVKRSMPDADDA